MIKKLLALINIALGLFLIFIVGGKFLLQAVSVIVGFVFLFRGFSMLTMARMASRFQANFFNNDRFE
jgi:hypothetical protein